MIGHVSGSVAAVSAEKVVVDVGGIGLEIAVPRRVVSDLVIGRPVRLHTHLHVRDDGMSLFGFATDEDRDVFRILLGASGVGPRLALTILGTFTVDALRRVVAADDVAGLTMVPGVGSRTAQRIILDLKPKLTAREAEAVGEATADLRAALAGLGYGPGEIRDVVAHADPDAPLADQVRSALRELAR